MTAPAKNSKGKPGGKGRRYMAQSLRSGRNFVRNPTRHNAALGKTLGKGAVGFAKEDKTKYGKRTIRRMVSVRRQLRGKSAGGAGRRRDRRGRFA